MAIRFRKRIKLMPGVHINLSKSGISTTVGPRGASVNVGKKGVYLNTSIPGTGISARTKLLDGKKTVATKAAPVTAARRLTPIAPEEHRYDPPPAILRTPRPPPLPEQTSPLKAITFGLLAVVFVLFLIAVL